LLHDEQGRPSAVVSFAIDVTDHFETAAALERAEHKWRALIENISDTVSIVDADANILETSGQFTDVLGYEADEWIGRNGFELFHPEDTAKAASAFARVLERPGAEERDVFRTRHASGHFELVEVTARNL